MNLLLGIFFRFASFLNLIVVAISVATKSPDWKSVLNLAIATIFWEMANLYGRKFYGETK